MIYNADADQELMEGDQVFIVVMDFGSKAGSWIVVGMSQSIII